MMSCLQGILDLPMGSWTTLMLNSDFILHTFLCGDIFSEWTFLVNLFVYYTHTRTHTQVSFLHKLSKVIKPSMQSMYTMKVCKQQEILRYIYSTSQHVLLNDLWSSHSGLCLGLLMSPVTPYCYMRTGGDSIEEGHKEMLKTWHRLISERW